MPEIEKRAEAIAHLENMQPVNLLLDEFRSGLSRYWEIAAGILGQSGVSLKALAAEDFSMEKNFFSFLFLYSFYRAGIPRSRRILYAAMLQCLRGMVTGCDNLLDNEYKKTLDTDIPEEAVRFRSVVDIMVSDRVLFQLLLEACQRQEIVVDKAMAAVAVSMKNMTRSGLQEASEENGISVILKPDELLQKVHHYKTGILFTCPWDIPLAVEGVDQTRIAPLMDGLYQIGMGCQIMDDAVDFMADLKRKRHNYLVSLIYHGANAMEKSRLQQLRAEGSPLRPAAVLDEAFPDSVSKASERSRRFLSNGLNRLFSKPHRFMVASAIQFLEKRIGVERLFRRQVNEI